MPAADIGKQVETHVATVGLGLDNGRATRRSPNEPVAGDESPPIAKADRTAAVALTTVVLLRTSSSARDGPDWRSLMVAQTTARPRRSYAVASMSAPSGRCPERSPSASATTQLRPRVSTVQSVMLAPSDATRKRHTNVAGTLTASGAAGMSA